MKKKNLFILPIMVAVCTFAFWQSSNADKELAYQNVEALSQEETSDADVWDCWSELKNNGGGVWSCGTPCVYEAHKKSKSGKSKCYKQ